MDNKQLYVPFVLCLFIPYITSDFYSSTADLRKLVHIERVLIDTLEQYINEETERLNSLRRFVELYKSEQSKALEDLDLYVSNPINSYLLIKRLTADWKEVEALMNVDNGQKYLQNITAYKENTKFPSAKDLTGAALALARLQVTYNLDVSDMMQGKIKDLQFSSKLTSSDCFELAQQYCESNEYNDCISWLAKTEVQFKREGKSTSPIIALLAQYMFTELRTGNLFEALDFSRQLVQLGPDNELALQSMKMIEKSLEDNENNNESVGEDGNEELQTEEKNYTSYESDFIRYNQLCRGEISNPRASASFFRCSYKHFDNPFLLIAPFKVEELYDDPELSVFHDIISNNEIDAIKRFVQPRFKRATVLLDGDRVEIEQRVSKTGFLYDDELQHTVLLPLIKRSSDMTGLAAESAEALQVVNYGIGGQYEPHFDYFKEANTLGRGNRIVTALIYMEDVMLGGATVFPSINITVWPKKGIAVVWKNLYPSGDGNPNSLHAGCPVLVGSKWVCNKWYRDQGNEIVKPCKLTDNRIEKSV